MKKKENQHLERQSTIENSLYFILLYNLLWVYFTCNCLHIIDIYSLSFGKKLIRFVKFVQIKL